MERLQNDFTLEIPSGCFPLTTDSMLLADFVRLPRNAMVLDLGSGCGTLGLLLCAKDRHCRVHGLEIDPVAHTAALENVQRNGLQERLSSQCADLRTATGNYHCCVSNPPYYTGGPASRTTPNARRDDLCDPDALMKAAADALRYGGDFFLVHKPERLAQLISCGSACGLEAKRLRLIRHHKNGPVTLILLQLRKGSKPGLVWEEAFLHDTDGTPSEYYRKLYHIQ
jgi:tRNA1(Val) A37 N6-methylase TrmN6